MSIGWQCCDLASAKSLLILPSVSNFAQFYCAKVRRIFRNSVAKKQNLCFYANNRGIRWFLTVDFRLGKTCFVEQFFQILRRIGCHALHYIRPLRIAIHHFYQDGELTARLQYTTSFEFPKIHKKAAQLEKTKNPIGKLFFSSWEVCE